jgi:hypothetical protein
MTRKIYRSAMGKPVDLGALFLQNEHVRAVGNMNVNARGDVLDSANRVVEPKNRQVQRKYRRQTNVSGGAATTGTMAAKQAAEMATKVDANDEFMDLIDDAPETVVVQEKTAVESTTATPRGGLAAAIARSREVKQELEKTARQRAQEQNLKRI